MDVMFFWFVTTVSFLHASEIANGLNAFICLWEPFVDDEAGATVCVCELVVQLGGCAICADDELCAVAEDCLVLYDLWQV